jgi:hypothetical protein
MIDFESQGAKRIIFFDIDQKSRPAVATTSEPLILARD